MPSLPVEGYDVSRRDGVTVIKPAVALPIDVPEAQPVQAPQLVSSSQPLMQSLGVDDVLRNLADKIKQFAEYDRKFTEDVINLPSAVSLKNANEFWQGLTGDKRHKTWPEEMITSAITAPNTAMTQGATTDKLIKPAMDVAGLAGTGGLAGSAGVTGALGSNPMLRPALKHAGKVYKGKEGQQHLDVLPRELQSEFQRMAMSGEDISNFNFGFINHKGQFLDRDAALKYAIDNGLVSPHDAKYGALTSTMMNDNRAGTALAAISKSEKPFFSALAQAVDGLSQKQASGDQWLGTLANKAGIKPDELEFTGLGKFLEGKPNVTKQEVQDYLKANQLELGDVWKGTHNPEALAAKKAFDDYGKELGDKYNLNPLQNLAMYRKIKNMDEAEVTKYLQLQDAYHKLNEAPKTKYHSYQLPGGENYRELLVTIPRTNRENTIPAKNISDKYQKEWDDLVKKQQEIRPLVDDYNRRLSGAEWDKANAEYRALGDAMDKLHYKMVDETIAANPGKHGDPYKSSHWDEPNILAHMRMNDRTVDGKKSLHLEEIQSDWHQAGRSKGYSVNPDTLRKTEKVMSVKDADPLFRSGLKDNGFDLNKIADEKLYVYDYNGVGGYSLKEPANNTTLKDWLDAGKAGAGTVPDAPFKKNWHELALKRAVREAAENGYDRISWTPGEAQAARYDLSKQVNLVSANKQSDGKYLVYIEGKDGQALFRRQNGFSDHGQKTMTADELVNTIGKEPADKIINGKPNKEGWIDLKDDKLKIGGEGMKGFYDKIIPKAIEKLTGQKVQTSNIGKDTGKDWAVRSIGNDHYVFGVGAPEMPFKTRSEAQKWLVDNSPKKEPIFYIDITPELREKALKGFPLFSAAPPIVGTND